MMHNPAHAGELISEWLEGLTEQGHPVTISKLAEIIQISRPMLSRIINGRAAVSADIALRLQAALGIDAEMLLRVQMQHDLWMASQQQRPVIAAIHTLPAPC